MRTHHTMRSLRWLFLAWMILIYLEGLWSFRLVSFTKCLFQSSCSFASFLPTLGDSNRISTGIFTGLMRLYGMLLWVSMGGSIPPRFLRYSLWFQGGLVLVIGLVVSPIAWPPLLASSTLVLNLSLVFILSVMSTLQSTRVIFRVVMGALALFILLHLWSLWPRVAIDWTSFLSLIGTQIDLTVIPFITGYVVFSLHLQHTHAQLKEAHADLATSHAKLEEAYDQLQIAAAQIEALTLVTERQRVARELHDTLAQGLTGLHLQLEAMRTGLHLQRYAQVQEMVDQSLFGTRNALAEARRAIDDLRTETAFPENLPEEVQQVISHCTATTTMICMTDLAALVFVPAALSEQVLRAIKEGLTNVVRHAEARRVWIDVSRREGMFVIEIRDDGIGFDPAAIETAAGHYGLLGLRERALLVGGEFSVVSAPGAGTTLRLGFPELKEGLILVFGELLGKVLHSSSHVQQALAC